MITLADYWMGRDESHTGELTEAIIANAIELLGRVNLLISFAHKDGVWPGIDMVTDTPVASGWRPASINARIDGAAKHSRHLTGRAIDIRDTLDRAFARWCLRHLDDLHEIGLWMEDPQWTPQWVHLQDEPPGSGRRVFIPSSRPPLVAKLPEQEHDHAA